MRPGRTRSRAEGEAGEACAVRARTSGDATMCGQRARNRMGRGAPGTGSFRLEGFPVRSRGAPAGWMTETLVAAGRGGSGWQHA